MYKIKLIALAFAAAVAADLFGGWSCSDSTLTWTENESTYWKLSVSVVDKAITLTSLASTIPADKALDLTGALEAYGLTDTGYSLAFAEGSGLSVFSSVEHLTVSGKWFALMATDSGAGLTALKSVRLGTADVDLQLGDTEGNTLDTASPVFGSKSTLTDVRVFGKSLTLKATFIKHTKLKTVSLRASGDLTVGYCTFYASRNGAFSIDHAEFASGGDLTLGGSSLRRALAAGAQVYVEAPATATVKLAASTFEGVSTMSRPFVLYWNAPKPNDAKNAFNVVEFDWQICNAPEIVSTFPEMDGENLKELGGHTSLRLPADTSDVETDGRWEATYAAGTTYAGEAHWSVAVPAAVIVGTNGWSFTRSTGRLVQTNALGTVQWELAATIDLNRVTLTPLTAVAPSDGILSLAGANLGLKWSDVHLSFAEGTGAFASVSALDLTGLPWLRQMDQQAAAPFSSLVSVRVGTETSNLQLGDNESVSSDIDATKSVFAARNSLKDVQVSGRDVILNNTFTAHRYVTNASVRATGSLVVGACAFYGSKNGSSLKCAEFVAGGDLTFGKRSLCRALAANAKVEVTAPAAAVVTCEANMFYDDDLDRPVKLYWNAPAPAVNENAMNKINLTWYVYNDSECTSTFQDPSGTKTLEGGYVTIALPGDVLNRRTAGSWRYGEGTAYPAYWYGKSGGLILIFR